MENINYHSRFIISDIRKLTSDTIIANKNNTSKDEYRNLLIKSASELEKDLSKHQNDVRVMIALGKIYRDISEISKDYEQYIKSEKYFNKALAINRYRPEAIFGLARTYMLQKKYQDAIVTINIFLEKNPQDYYCHFMLGAIYDEMGEEKKARVKYKEAQIFWRRNFNQEIMQTELRRY